MSAPCTPTLRRRLAVAVATATLASGAVTALPPSPAGAVAASYEAMSRVSVTSTGGELDGFAFDEVLVDRSGRFVAFSASGPLQADDTNGDRDVYLRDRLGGTTKRVSLTDGDAQIPGNSLLCGLSRSGRFIGFVAKAPNLPVPASDQIYVRDRYARTTTLVSVSSTEVPSNDGATSGIWADEPCPISDDGRFVAFTTEAPGLAPTDADASTDVFRRDLQTGTTTHVSVSGGGADANDAAHDVALSADGKTLAFASEATNLVAGDSNGHSDVFLRLPATSSTVRMSVKAGGGQVNAWSDDPDLSSDGLWVAFRSSDADLVPGDTNDEYDVFVRNRTTGAVVRASLSSSEAQSTDGGSGQAAISDDGRYVSFSTYSADLVPQDGNEDDDVLRRDLTLGETLLVSRSIAGPTGSDQSLHPSISGDGSVIAFTSSSFDLVDGDGNGSRDAFALDLAQETTPFADTEAFVDQQFADFAGRAPTPAEAILWRDRLANGEVSPDEVVDALAHSTAWSAKRAPLIRLYWSFFLRRPDLAGMDYWVGKLKAGQTLAQVASKFARSPEFETKYGSASNSQFVTLVYQNVLSRDPDAAGLAYWTTRLDDGTKTRGDVMTNFSESSEGRRRMAPQVDTILIWVGMLRQMPPAGSFGDLVEVMVAWGEPPEVVSQLVRDLPPYAARVATGA
jgi:Tol biopolymer transport system component